MEIAGELLTVMYAAEVHASHAHLISTLMQTAQVAYPASTLAQTSAFFVFHRFLTVTHAVVAQFAHNVKLDFYSITMHVQHVIQASILLKEHVRCAWVLSIIAWNAPIVQLAYHASAVIQHKATVLAAIHTTSWTKLMGARCVLSH